MFSFVKQLLLCFGSSGSELHAHSIHDQQVMPEHHGGVRMLFGAFSDAEAAAMLVKLKMEVAAKERKVLVPAWRNIMMLGFMHVWMYP